MTQKLTKSEGRRSCSDAGRDVINECGIRSTVFWKTRHLLWAVLTDHCVYAHAELSLMRRGKNSSMELNWKVTFHNIILFVNYFAMLPVAQVELLSLHLCRGTEENYEKFSVKHYKEGSIRGKFLKLTGE